MRGLPHWVLLRGKHSRPRAATAAVNTTIAMKMPWRPRTGIGKGWCCPRRGLEAVFPSVP